MKLSRIAGGFDRPMKLQSADDGSNRLFIVAVLCIVSSQRRQLRLSSNHWIIGSVFEARSQTFVLGDKGLDLQFQRMIALHDLFALRLQLSHLCFHFPQCGLQL